MYGTNHVHNNVDSNSWEPANFLNEFAQQIILNDVTFTSEIATTVSLISKQEGFYEFERL